MKFVAGLIHAPESGINLTSRLCAVTYKSKLVVREPTPASGMGPAKLSTAIGAGGQFNGRMEKGRKLS